MNNCAGCLRFWSSILRKRASKLVGDFYRQESRWKELVSAHLRFSEDSNEKDERLANLYQACELVEDVIVDRTGGGVMATSVGEDPVTIELSKAWSVSILYRPIWTWCFSRRTV